MLALTMKRDWLAMHLPLLSVRFLIPFATYRCKYVAIQEAGRFAP